VGGTGAVLLLGDEIENSIHITIEDMATGTQKRDSGIWQRPRRKFFR